MSAAYRVGISFSYPYSCSDHDLWVIEKQMSKRNFSPKMVYAVGERCVWGFPRVVICRPLYAMKPFPTTFWLTCPWLVRECGRCESGGGIGDLENFMSSKAKDWSSYNVCLRALRISLLGTAERNFLRLRRRGRWEVLRRTLIGGIAGSGRRPVMKCLHLQVAAWLGIGYHPGKEWLSAKFPVLDCSDPSRYPCCRG